MTTVLNDVLLFSRAESGAVALDPSSFRLASLVEDVCICIVPATLGRDLSLSYVVDPAIPKYCVADSMRLRQVLLNLLGNSAKFCESGQISLTVTRNHHISKDNALFVDFAVSDTGIGISKEQQAALFTPFVQADAGINRRFGGTGLGLSISQRLIALFNEDDPVIHVESRLGRGSTFSFTIPFAFDPDHPPTPANVLRSPVGASPRGLPPLRLLCVIDSDVTMRHIENILGETHDVTIVEAQTVARALSALRLALLRAERFDVLVVGWRMLSGGAGENFSTDEAIRQALLCPRMSSESPTGTDPAPTRFVIIGPETERQRMCQAYSCADFVAFPVISRHIRLKMAIRREARAASSPKAGRVAIQVPNVPSSPAVAVGGVGNFSVPPSPIARKGGNAVSTLPGDFATAPRASPFMGDKGPGTGSLAHGSARGSFRKTDSELIAADNAAVGDATVLVVDDNFVNLKVLAALLGQAGVKVATAICGLDGFTATQQYNYETILMDIHMPDMDGFECTRLIREAEKERKDGHRAQIVGVTADVDPTVRSSAIKCGFDDLITKPVRKAALLNLLGIEALPGGTLLMAP